MNKYVLIFLVTIFFSCKVKDNKQTKVEEVFSDVLVKLIDSTVTDFRKIIAPSQNDLLDEESKIKYYKKVDSLKKIKFSPLKIIIEDSLYNLNISSAKYRVKNHLNEDDIIQIINFKDPLLNNKLILNLNNFSNDKYHLIYENDFNKDNRQENIGKYSFSKLHFNKSNTICVFSFGLYYSKLNGSNFLCILQKNKSKWHIQQIILMSIS